MWSHTLCRRKNAKKQRYSISSAQFSVICDFLWKFSFLPGLLSLQLVMHRHNILHVNKSRPFSPFLCWSWLCYDFFMSFNFHSFSDPYILLVFVFGFAECAFYSWSSTNLSDFLYTYKLPAHQINNNQLTEYIKFPVYIYRLEFTTLFWFVCVWLDRLFLICLALHLSPISNLQSPMIVEAVLASLNAIHNNIDKLAWTERVQLQRWFARTHTQTLESTWLGNNYHTSIQTHYYFSIRMVFLCSSFLMLCTLALRWAL